MQVVGRIWLPALLLNSLMREMHPPRNSRGVLIYGYWPPIQAVDAEVEFGQVQEPARLQDVRYLIYERFIVSNL